MLFDVFIMDMGGHDSNVRALQSKFPHARTLRWTDHLHTLRRAMTQCRTRSAWVISSCIDYTGFDWLWEPPPWQAHQIHCWPSGSQQFGDTFLVPREPWQEQQAQLERLEQYRDVNFEHQSLARLPWDRVEYTQDTVVEALAQPCRTPYVLFAPPGRNIENLPDPWLWRESPVVTLSRDNAVELIPRAAHGQIQQQVYDYAWIDSQHNDWIPSTQQDIVFISYDEPQADLNWQKLKQKHPRALRVHGVAGMERALEAAANCATTPWYFAVFAKTEIHPEFGFDFVPDYMQRPKHYIFDCLNSVNGLQYGHMGVVMYNCQGIREQNRRPDGFGLDYTMSWPHEHIPLLSCVSNFDTTAYHAWRTAFREAAKLSWFERIQPTIDGSYRLRVWTTRAQGPQARWCLLGAHEGVEFAQSCNNLDDIKQSFQWTWLRERFVTQHGPLD